MARIEQTMERLHQPLYDSVIFTASVNVANPLVFFTVPLGQSSKTLLDTNMKSGGALPAPQVFEVMGISIGCFPQETGTTAVDVDDLREVLHKAYFQFFIDSKEMFTMAPLAKLPAGGGIHASAYGTGAATLTVGDVGNGEANAHNIYTLSETFVIDVQQSFRAEVHFDSTYQTSNADLKMYVYLEGILTRSVQ